MKAVILGGGFGTRLGNLTRFLPKSLLEIRKKTILEWQIKQLKKSGVKEVFVNTHFLHKQFKQKLNYSKKILGIKIHFKYQKYLNGTAGAVKIFEKELLKEKYFFVIYGDILFKENLNDLISFHNNRNSICSIYVHHRQVSNSIVKFSKKDGMITSFLERPSKNIKESAMKELDNNIGVNSSIYLMNSTVLKGISKKTFSDFPKDIFPNLIKRNKIFALKIRKKRFAIDSIKQLNEARRQFN